ncbi:CRISPR system CASCADE complex protein CasE [Bifidobacterium gallicum DSM 20093 = LMG 11596]|nr:CRISPR system CASCADE complex protein CasE [Bifidobacterium gallicum DSM 20093 = LMG 11596]
MARIGARQLAASPYKLHAAVEASFPPHAPRATDEGRILWRLDHNRQDHSVWLYVVSPSQPDLLHIVEQAGWPGYAEWETKDYTPFLDRLAQGQQWHYRVCANPVRNAATDLNLHNSLATFDKMKGSRQAYVTVRQQIDWFERRAAANGFSLPERDPVSGFDEQVKDPLLLSSVRVIDRQRHKFRDRKNQVTLSTAVFEGTLQVEDPQSLRHALCFGIGKAKGFGCGLMTLAPIMTP